tara:strand:+ start:654 stop:914 length:261 start_codon:yes stop_codon:yes gene_type:complete
MIGAVCDPIISAAVRGTIPISVRAPVVGALLHIKKQVGVLGRYRSGHSHEHYKAKTGTAGDMTKRASRTCGCKANKHAISSYSGSA